MKFADGLLALMVLVLVGAVGALLIVRIGVPAPLVLIPGAGALCAVLAWLHERLRRSRPE